MGKTIRLYLVDGVPTGILTAEIMNWTGTVLVTPRTRLAEIASRSEAQGTGIYFLVGDDVDSPRQRVYVGEADNVFSRLSVHGKDPEKDFWTNTILVTSKDLNLTKAHVRYLESRLLTMARQAGRARLANGTAPVPNQLPEPDVSDMDFFLEQIQIVLPALGYTFLQPATGAIQTREAPADTQSTPTFELTQGKYHARAIEVGSGLVVLAGSTARREGVPSWAYYKPERALLEQEGKLREKDDPELLVFTQDVPFPSPSAAPAAVLGRNANGRAEWKVQGRAQSYQAWAEQRLAAVTSPEATREEDPESRPKSPGESSPVVDQAHTKREARRNN